MRQMTLRDIPEDVEAVVRNEADISGISLNKAFLTVLKRGAQQSLNTAAPVIKRTKNRFSRFCGIWSNDETAVFDDAINKQRVVDNELWQ